MSTVRRENPEFQDRSGHSSEQTTTQKKLQHQVFDKELTDCNGSGSGDWTLKSAVCQESEQVEQDICNSHLSTNEVDNRGC